MQKRSFFALLLGQLFPRQAAKVFVMGVLASLSLSASAAPTPFPTGNPIIFVSEGVPKASLNPTSMELYSVEQIPGGDFKFTEIGTSTIVYNAVGFHTSDMYLYAIERGTGNLLRIGQGGEVERLGAVSGLPSNATIAGNGSFNAGDFGDETCALANCQDILFVRLGSNDTSYTNKLWAININTLTATTITLKSAVPNTSDIFFSEGYLWAINGNVTGTNAKAIVYRIDPSSGQVNTFTLPTVANKAITTDGIIRQAYGAQWRYGNGDFGIAGNDTGVAYHIKVTTDASGVPSFQIVSALSAPNSANNDGASYAGAPIDMSITKTVSSAAYDPGDTISYTFTVKNNDPAFWSSGSIITDMLPTGLSLTTIPTGCSISSNVLTCAVGALKGGEETSMTVTGTISAGANAPISNKATVTGNEKEKDEDLWDNTSNTVVTNPKTTPTVPIVGITKTADVGEIAPGGTIVYTISVENESSFDATDVVVSDPVPAGVDSFEWTCAGVACPSANGMGAINDMLTKLAVGDSMVYTVTATVSSAPPTSIVNTAELTVPGGECAQGECASSAPVPVVAVTIISPPSLAASVPALSWTALLCLIALSTGIAVRCAVTRKR
ncbi:MAG: DUF11 domain-containing protein [Proteobacteria bacterium]|nr:DUF11 domain-containing protein [Pseudomonadota bacterium]